MGSELVTATLTNLTTKPVQAAPMLRRLWHGGAATAAELFQNSLLTGFEATNFGGNLTLTLHHLAVHVVAAARSTLTGATAGQKVYWSEPPAMLFGAAIGVARGLGSAVRMVAHNTPIGAIRAGVQAAGRGEPILAAMAEQARTVMPSGFGTSKVTFTKARAISSVNYGISGVGGLVADLIGSSVATFGMTGVNATDEVFKFTNQQMSLYGLAIRSAMDSGARDWTAIKLHMETFLHDPPRGAMAVANDTANLLTLTNQLPQYLRDVRTAMAHPAFRFIAPFWASPMQLQRYNFAQWPVLGRLVDYQRQALEQGGAAAQIAKARMAMGAALLGTSAALVWNGDQGIPVPGTQMRVRYRGRGFSQPGLAQLEKQEHIPYSLGIQKTANGPWLELGNARMDFPAVTMGMVADAMELFTYIHDDQLFEELVTAIGTSTWNNVVDRSTLQGFANLFETFTSDQPETYALRTGRFVRSIVGSVVPMGVAQIEKHLDPSVKEVYGLMDQIYSRTPVLSERLSKRHDILGDPIMRPLGYPPSVSLFSPIPGREVPGDHVRQELLKNEVGLLPPPPYLFGANPDRTGPPDPKEGILLTTGPGSQYERLEQIRTHGKIPVGALAQIAGLDLSGSGVPVIRNPDGSISTERTITIEVDGRHFVIPTIVNGHQLSENQAVAAWRAGTNPEVGVFKDQKSADAFAVQRSAAGGKIGDSKRLTLKQALEAVTRTHEYRDVLSPGRGGGQANVLTRIITAYRNMAEGYLLKEDQGLMQQYIQHSVDKANAMVQPEYRHQRFQADVPSQKAVEALSR
jgi:hypothetical protein